MLDYFSHLSARAQIILWALMQFPAFAALEILFRLERPFDPNFVHVDVQLYYNAARAALAGQLPYRDFLFPYPPGSLLFFLPPAVISADAIAFFRWFEVWVLILDWVMLAATAFLALKLGRSLNRTLLLYTLAIPAMGVIVWQRYDVAPAMIVVLAFAAWHKNWHDVTWLLLGLGTAVKIYPGLLAPLFAIPEYRARGIRGAGRGIAIFSAVMVLGFAPFFIAAFEETAQTFFSQTGRGFEIESVGSTLMVVGSWFGLPAQAIYWRRLNTWDIDSPAAGTLQVLFLGLEAATTLFVYWKFWREELPGLSLLIQFALVLIALNLLTTKVFSAQFVIWLFPLAMLGGRNKSITLAVLFIITAFLTQWIFPFSWQQLKQLAPYTTIALLTRDAVLLVMVLVALREQDAPKARL